MSCSHSILSSAPLTHISHTLLRCVCTLQRSHTKWPVHIISLYVIINIWTHCMIGPSTWYESSLSLLTVDATHLHTLCMNMLMGCSLLFFPSLSLSLPAHTGTTLAPTARHHFRYIIIQLIFNIATPVFLE